MRVSVGWTAAAFLAGLLLATHPELIAPIAEGVARGLTKTEAEEKAPWP